MPFMFYKIITIKYKTKFLTLPNLHLFLSKKKFTIFALQKNIYEFIENFKKYFKYIK